MVVVDSSALIPLAWIGHLDLISNTFPEARSTNAVRGELLTEGKRGTATLTEFLDTVEIHESPDGAEEVASMEGVTPADASVILLADSTEDILLANDKGLIEVAESFSVECWWVTTLLLRCSKTGDLSAHEATDILYDLVDEGMNLHPQVYTQVQKKLRDLGK